MVGIREQLGAPKAGDFLGIVKFNSLAGRFWKADKDTLGQPLLTDLLNKAIAVDFATAEIGWMRFGPTGPIRHMAPVGHPPVLMPDEKDSGGKPTFRPGFYVRVAGQAVDGIREWCSTTGVLIDMFDSLWAQYEAAPEAQRGEIPLIVMTGANPSIKGTGARRTTTYMPAVSITGWVARPASLGERTVILSPKPATAPQPPASPQLTAPTTAAPAAQRAPAQAGAPATTNLPVDAMPF